MPIEFRCIRCGQRLRVANSDQGNRARCPTCNAIVDVPSDAAPESPMMVSREKSDVIDYELFGSECQYVEITLDPGEIALARLESLLHMTPGIAMEQSVPDGANSSGLLEKISQVGWRILMGSSLQMTAFCNVADQREVVAFAPATSSRLVPVHLDEFGETIICQSKAILCVARGTEFRDTNVPALSDAAMCTMTGDGIAILQTGGQLFHRSLTAGKTVIARTSSIVAYTNEVAVASHESVGVEDPTTIARITGPGEVWLRVGS